MDSNNTHKLATILALDIAGYSARTESDEAKATSEVANLHILVREIAEDHGGRVFNTAGDGFMLELPSCHAAIAAASELAERCEPKVRIGVHVGDALTQPGGDLLGHGVNVAARLMARATPGTALVSIDVKRMIRAPLNNRLTSPRVVKLDKMRESIEAFELLPIPATRLADDTALRLPTDVGPCLEAGRERRGLNLPALMRFASWAVLRPPGDLRVSFAAMLRVAHAGRYVLIRNLHRQEVFGPIGGVYKFSRSGGDFLDTVQFRGEGTPRLEDSVDDIRGFIPCVSALKFKRWFARCVDRENAAACIYRELYEELEEIGLSRSLTLPRALPLRKVRSVEEGPCVPTGKTYCQYRIFDIYELDTDGAECDIMRFCVALIEDAKTHPDLEFVTAEEIKSGRSVSGNVLGHHSAYLFGKRAFRDDAPMYQDRGMNDERRSR